MYVLVSKIVRGIFLLTSFCINGIAGCYAQFKVPIMYQLIGNMQ